LAGALPRALQAQWVTQTIKLVPGFNPVFLQVTPADPSCVSVFGSMPQVREVWMYNRYLQTSTFTGSPGQDALGQDHWLTWFRTEGPKNFLSTLAQVRGGQSYLIKLATNAQPQTITIKGIPIPPRSDWIPNDIVLAGFPIVESSGVTFYQFLKDSPQVSATPGQDSAVFTVNPLTAFETQIRNPEVTKIVPGRAYWAFLQGHSHNPYPFEVTAPGENNSVQFLQDNPLSALTLNNSITGASQVLHLRLIESETPPAGKPNYAGPVPVVALTPGADGNYTIGNLANGLDVTLLPGEKRTVRLGALLRQLIPSSDTNATYQVLIEVTDKVHGYRQLVPVVAEVPGSKLFGRVGSLMGNENAGRKKSGVKDASDPGTVASLSAGLWVGTVTMNAVNTPGFAQTNNPDPSQFPVIAATPLNTRVLVHVNSNGVSRLVQQVFFADVSDGTNRVTHMYRSMTNIPTGGVLKSRVSAPAWPALAPTDMTGAFGSNISATVRVPFNDPVNPFVHHYHPDHNNLAEDFKTPLASGVESFDITRSVGFYFGDTTQTGTSTYAPAVPAMKFTGTNGEYIKTSAFSTTTGFSAQFWVNCSTYQQNGATLLLLTNASSGSQFKIGFQANTGNLGVTVRNGSGVTGQLFTASPLPLSSWVNFTATYDGTNGNLYVNGVQAAASYLPTLTSGAWDSVWLGNTATSGLPSFVGELHDVVIRNGTLTLQTIPQLMVVPQLLNASSIVVNLQGNAVATNVVNQGTSSVSIILPSTQLIDLGSAPSVPLWTYGTAQGTYQETITGLRKQAITVQGSFQFTRVSQDANLY
jgi:hypothetical protein